MTEEIKGRSFDALAKGLASGEVSRGKALKLMVAALFGGAFASIPGAALAQSSGRGRPTGSQGCPIPGQIRVKGQCECPPGSELCGGQCLATCPSGAQRDPQLCECICPTGFGLCSTGSVPGSTLNCCASGTQQCCQGQCYPFCPAGEIRNGFNCQCEPEPTCPPFCD